MKDFQKTYDNGLRLILEQNDRPVTATSIMFFVGSQNEKPEEEGFAHFVEHMIFKSSKNYTTEAAMDMLTKLGSDYNAYTSKTVTRFVFKCLSESFEDVFKIYSDLILHPKFNDDEMQKEREVIVEEMKKCHDDPVEIMYDSSIENFYSGFRYAHDVLGTEENILGVSHETLLAFKNKYYKLNNCIISITGNLDFDKVDKIVKRYFADEDNTKNEPYSVDFSKLEPNISEKYKIIERDDGQANVCVMIDSINYVNDKKYIADIYSAIIGNSQNSRLFKKVREELGLVYSIYATAEFGAKTGDFAIIFGTRPKNIKKALSVIKSEINALAETGVTEEEVIVAKNFRKSCSVFELENSSVIADLNASMVHYHGKPITQEERIACYDKVTADEVNSFAKTMASETKYAIVAVGKGIKKSDLEIFWQKNFKYCHKLVDNIFFWSYIISSC